MILILLTILKITGILLLVLLGLIVLVLFLIVFAPVRYRAKGAKHPDELSVNARVTYLSPLVRVRLSYPSETILSVKILWFDLLNPKEKKPGKKKKRKKTEPEQTEPKPEPKPPEMKESEPKQPEMREPKPGQPEMREPKPGQPERKQSEPEQFKARQSESEQFKARHGEPERSGPQEKKKREKKPDPKSGNAAHDDKTENKLVALAALIWQYKEMYPDVLGRLFHALKSILPRKCRIYLIFGTGSPDQTGCLYGAYCALQEYLPGTIVFEPVWMESYLDVEFELSGNIRLIHFVTAAVKIIADKRVRSFISEIRRL